MSGEPSPIYIGKFPAIKAGDVRDLYIDITADLVAGEAIASVAFTVIDSSGDTVAGVVGVHNETDTRTDFRITAPAAGAYVLTAVFTIDDGQKITRIAKLSIY